MRVLTTMRLQAAAGCVGIAAIVMLAVAAGHCEDAAGQSAASAGNPAAGARLIRQIGCGSCHSIPGIPGAAGLVGPPLDNIGARTIIAGLLPNTTENMVRWIEEPQSIVPGNAMPDTGVNDHDARDIAAYLYTLR